MTGTCKKRGFSGTTQKQARAYELTHRALSGRAAREGMVLLKNEGQLLPLQKGSKVALFGAGAVVTIKGGTGSGDVNARETVSIADGLEQAGFSLTTKQWLSSYRHIYDQERIRWREAVWKKADASTDQTMGFFDAYTSTPFLIPSGAPAYATDTDTAVFVLSRNAGEGADRYCAPGDYYLTAQEKELLTQVCGLYAHVVVVLNIGGLVDLCFLDSFSAIEAVIYAQQPGMEAGSALAALLCGEADFSGKLTDSWAYRYEDYPSAPTFSHNNGDITQDRYEEGIFVGYRFFDTYEKPVRYCFGYGLSYTQFSLQTMGITHFDLGTDHAEIGVQVQVTNTGKYTGREVVQVYVSCPQSGMEKEYRRLAGYAKTQLLMPGQMQELMIRFPLEALSSFSEQLPGFVLEQGRYGIFVGSSLDASQPEASLLLQDELIAQRTKHICPLQTDLRDTALLPPFPAERIAARRADWERALAGKPEILLHQGDLVTRSALYTEGYEEIPQEVQTYVDSLSTDQLIRLATGEIGNSKSNLGSAGKSVPGSAAQTSTCALEQNLASIVLADGPAGLRLIREYQVENGEMVPAPLEMSMEQGFLCREQPEKRGETWYQYCTAFPVGTLLAQTWDTELLREVGKAVAQEMQLFGVTLWLAPGMNIHRNPLCGRNFEYYSEDPLVSGLCAAAITRGVQSEYGCGTTIKHFACNNQEDNRKHSNSIVSERALRELYLRGFEIAVRISQPMAMMTSYNLINGVHAANSHDLCTAVARNEWGFRGLIMTDWTTTHDGPDCTASGCMRAGNDVVMPGIGGDHENMRAELAEGTLSIRQLKRSVCHLVMTIWQSNQYEQ